MRRLSAFQLFGTMVFAAGGVQASTQETIRYIHTDALGSVAAITDTNGHVIERREYEPYGAQLVPEVQDGPGYTGHVQDAETGLVYMQQRYYDPSIGQFLSPDPIVAYGNSVGQFNRFRYANENPYRYFDPDGRLGCTGTRIKLTCDGGGIAALRTSARSPLDTGDLRRTKSHDPAPNVKLRHGVELTDDFLRADLQAFSNSLDGKDIDVISGYRSDQKQRDLASSNRRAARSSQHTYGRAADIKVTGMTQNELGSAAHLFGRFGRVNVYGDAAAGVHIDYKDVGEGSRLYQDWRRANP